MLIALNKPYHVLCQFSPEGGKTTLAEFVAVPHVYPAGRLDFDSEGLVLLTDDGRLQQRLSAPEKGIDKTYWAEVEGALNADALARLESGVMLDGRMTRPAKARRLDCAPDLWPRHPPIRVRQSIPTDWLELKLQEGRNRQVRRMTAAVGLPTLRLVRIAIGGLHLLSLGLAPGRWETVNATAIAPDLLQKRTPGGLARRSP